jgi:hypothetical protein
MHRDPDSFGGSFIVVEAEIAPLDVHFLVGLDVLDQHAFRKDEILDECAVFFAVQHFVLFFVIASAALCSLRIRAILEIVQSLYASRMDAISAISLFSVV